MRSKKIQCDHISRTLEFSGKIETLLSDEDLEDAKTEFIWFFNGNNNARQLFTKSNHDYLDGLYKRYTNEIEKLERHYGLTEIIEESTYIHNWFRNWRKLEIFTKEEFFEKIKLDDSFSEIWADTGVSDGLEFRNWGVQVQFDIDDKASIKQKGIDQLTNAINSLALNPVSGKHIMTFYNPSNIEERIYAPDILMCQFDCEELEMKERIAWFHSNYSKKGDSLSATSKKLKGKDLRKVKVNDGFVCIPSYKMNLAVTLNKFENELDFEKSEVFSNLLILVFSKIMNMVPGYLSMNFIKKYSENPKKEKRKVFLEFKLDTSSIYSLNYEQIIIKNE